MAHGLPLSQADRRAAAERIIATHPHMSDRAIGHSVGLAAKTVAAIRKSSSEEKPQSNARVGRDGRVRPLDSGVGRRRAAELLAQRPEASLRDVARAAGISPATALDVRKRLNRGESPVPAESPPRIAARCKMPATDGAEAGPVGTAPPPIWPFGFGSRATASNPAAAVEKLLRDPSLRNNELGKGMLRLLHVNAVGAEQLPDAPRLRPRIASASSCNSPASTPRWAGLRPGNWMAGHGSSTRRRPPAEPLGVRVYLGVRGRASDLCRSLEVHCRQ